MAINQDTINRAGLGGQLSSLGARQEKLYSQEEELGKQQQTISQEQERLIAERGKATEPIRGQIEEKLKQAPTDKIQEEAIPEYKRPTLTPQELNESFGMLMAASMLTGAASRTPYYGLMGAMTGAMDGFMKGDQAVVKESMQVFEKNLQSIKEKNAQKKREYDNAWETYKNDLSGLKGQLEIIAAKYDDPLALQAARSKSIGEAMKIIDSNIKHNDSTIDRLDRLKMHAEDLQSRRQQQQGTPTEIENMAQAIANYQLQPLSSFVMKTPYGQQVMSRVMQLNPTYDAKMYAAGTKAERDFSTGKQGQQVNSFNVAIAHLGTLEKLSDALENNDIKAINRLSQFYREQTGQEAPTNFDSAKQIVGQEIVKAIVSGGGGVTERQEAGQRLDRASSPEQLKGVIRTYKELLGGQLGGLKLQYEQTTGRKDFDTRLTPEAKKQLIESGFSGGGKITPSGPSEGTVEDGYRFKGGDPSDPKNWEKL